MAKNAFFKQTQSLKSAFESLGRSVYQERYNFPLKKTLSGQTSPLEKSKLNLTVRNYPQTMHRLRICRDMPSFSHVAASKSYSLPPCRTTLPAIPINNPLSVPMVFALCSSGSKSSL